MPSVLSRLSAYLTPLSSHLFPYLTPQWLLLFLGSYIAYRLAMRSWLERAAQSRVEKARIIKRARLDGEIAAVAERTQDTQEQRAQDGLEGKIVTQSATELVAKLQTGEYSARLVLHSLLARMIIAQKQFNVLSESNFVQALDDADKADKHLQSTGRPLGRLHGLPISMKDGANIAGLDSTLGLVRFCGLPASEDALIVQLLKKQGAIIHAKSNIPQTLLSFECSNPLHGRALNPYNKKLTPGGSSGGESAMMASFASVVGIGTDIGGSVRIPAHFAGQSALKPTARRISLQGFRSSVPGQEAIPAVAGPMAPHVEDLALLMKELWVQDAWDRDSDLVPVSMDMNEYKNNGKLNVGYYIDDGFIGASPACSRAVLDAVSALRADGHTCTQFTPPRILDCMALYYSLITSDGCNTIGNQLDGEVWEDYCKTLITGVRLPAKIKAAVSFMLENLMKDPKAATITKASRERTVTELWALQYERKKLRQDWFDAWKAAGNFDVILCPAHVLPAVAHGSFKKISFTCSYTLVFNVLDLPAGIVPITTVNQATDAYKTPASGLLEKAARSCYDPVLQHGMPLGVQVVGLPFRDETVLRAMRIIEGLVNYKAPEIQV